MTKPLARQLAEANEQIFLLRTDINTQERLIEQLLAGIEVIESGHCRTGPSQFARELLRAVETRQPTSDEIFLEMKSEYTG